MASSLLSSQRVDPSAPDDAAHEATQTLGIELPCTRSQPDETLEDDILREIIRRLAAQHVTGVPSGNRKDPKKEGCFSGLVG
jgi:hypothetical protein